MKNILLLIHDDAGQNARLQAALDIARATGGHLHCVDISVMPAIVGDYWAGDAAAMLLSDERTREASNRQSIEAHLKQEDVPWTWTDVVGEIAPCLEQAATLSELIVVNRRLDGSPWPDTRTIASDLILNSGKPVLAVPGDSAGLDVTGRAMVAWDGSAEADAAIQAAVPLLQLAAQVTLLEIVDGKSRTVPAERAAEFLSRHDVHAEICREPAGQRSIEDAILDALKQHRANYLVMGGFGHTRIREALFGGVTRAMLTASPVPVLFAH